VFLGLDMKISCYWKKKGGEKKGKLSIVLVKQIIFKEKCGCWYRHCPGLIP
jgi:hypothetical protein